MEHELTLKQAIIAMLINFVLFLFAAAICSAESY